MDALTGEDPLPLTWIWTLNQNEGSILILAVLLAISAFFVLFFSGSIPAFRSLLPSFSSPGRLTTTSNSIQAEDLESNSTKDSSLSSVSVTGQGKAEVGNASMQASSVSVTGQVKAEVGNASMQASSVSVTGQGKAEVGNASMQASSMLSSHLIEGVAGHESSKLPPRQSQKAPINASGVLFSEGKSDLGLGNPPDSLQIKAILQFLSIFSNIFFASIAFLLGLGFLVISGFSLAWMIVLDFAGVFLLLYLLRLFSSYVALKKPAYVLRVCLPFIRTLAHVIVFLTSYYSQAIRRTIHKHLTPQAITMDELSEAIENQAEKNEGEAKILRSIVEFGEVEVKEVMKSRGEVVVLDIAFTFKQLLGEIIESGYSRMPVIDQSFDQVAGILYIKDILPYLQEGDDFTWQHLIRQPYFTVESKLLSDLLEEFRFQKNHMAIVVDEYGGTSGIITLEDILEEIVGEITDEMDEAEVTYSQIGPYTYLFEGKTLLNDFLRILGEESDYFDDYRGETESLAGLILEKTGVIPEKGCEISIREYFFRIKMVDSRRIKQIEVNVNKSTKS
ncbi:MAG: CBS domain-containing protein [Bacteroidales bacterium]|nr:CBS domain-containing protein [Bacteroidales bacterium]